MPSLIEGYNCDVFISYRQNDDKSGWVSAFVNALRAELATLVKEPVTVYFDTDPREGLQETHLVDKSIERRLRSLVFIPIVSQTYCDPSSFAWKNEFCAFQRAASMDPFGVAVDLRGGNVGSRILPIRIHDLETPDEQRLTDQLGHPPRFVDFVFRAPGMNRPLRPGEISGHGVRFEDQVNKLAVGIKEVIVALQDRRDRAAANAQSPGRKAGPFRKNRTLAGAAVFALLALVFLVIYKPELKPVPFAAELDRVEKYLEEAGRFGDQRYVHNAHDVLRRVLAQDSLNERALFLITLVMEDSGRRGEPYRQRLYRRYPSGVYSLMARADDQLRNGNRPAALESLGKVLAMDPENKDALGMYSSMSLFAGNYVESWQAAQKYQQVHQEALNDLLTRLFLELGDFQEARHYLNQKNLTKEFSCSDLEFLQRIRLCAGDFEKLESETDSICRVTKCEECPFWQLRAKVHTGKFQEARRFVSAALKNPKITWRLPAYVLLKTGTLDSANQVADAELAYDHEKLADTAYRQSLPLYSLAAIHAMRGETSTSIKYFRKYADAGFEMGSEWYAPHDPLFDSAQSDKKFFGDFMQIVQKAQARKIALREKIRNLE